MNAMNQINVIKPQQYQRPASHLGKQGNSNKNIIKIKEKSVGKLRSNDE